MRFPVVRLASMLDAAHDRRARGGFLMRSWLLAAAVAAVSALPVPAFAQAAAPPAAVPATDCADTAQALRDLMYRDERMRDWPQLGRYRGLNADVKKSGEPVDVVFLGDSITDNWDTERFATWFAGKHYLNRGISGQTTPQMLVRLRPDVLTFKPKVMVLLAGTNDIAGNTGPMTDGDIEENVAAIAELTSSHGVKVVLASVLPVSNYHTKPDAPAQTVRRPMARIAALNKWLKSYADEHHHVYLDYFSAVTDASGLLRAELSADDLHPNAEGYTIMAPLAQAAIEKAMAAR
jgi:lysophospholipase L1-like esterase